ncbi:LysR family transcriptional regulator [Curvibacter sp. CHRR-16]|uniref:LysR family transcriptional regulator n=1 Tax=Curvibacter sp. CHRR-16 TaxID=2835872 RepID=UPI001BD9648C|nr:LysR family transcriptional regulator [Curvibacter sp. CHRR-16]MBT0569169.1 LysR family transcriptional regulator [Curvibacter sp. CHRR-16]
MREKKSHFSSTPPLNALRFFEAAARLGSFVQAADELHVTHGAVSRQIRALEERLGQALFERRNRAVFLTPAGLALQDTCDQAFAVLAKGLQAISQATNEPNLVLSCEPTIAIQWLIPRLPLWQAQHPHWNIHLLTAGGPVDFAQQRIDLALRRNDFAWPHTYHAHPVGPEYMGPVLRPSHPTSTTTTSAPTAWRRLHSRSRPQAWGQWLNTHPDALPEQVGDDYFEHFYLCLQAAEAGLGAAMSSVYMVGEALTQQRPQAPWGFTADSSAYVLLSPTPLGSDAKRQAFAHWLTDQFQKTLSENARHISHIG